MVYLSANGEVIGQFDAKELPAVLAGGRIPSEAFFWREGMPEWRPLRELVLPPARRPPPAAGTPKIEPIRHFPAASSKPAIGSKLQLDPSTGRRAEVRRPFTQPTDAKIPAEPAAEPAVSPEPDLVSPGAPRQKPAGQTFVPGHRAPLAASAPTVGAEPAEDRPVPPKRRGRALAWTAFSLMLLGAAGAAAWWFFLAEPPSLSGEVRVAAADGTMGPVAGATVYLVSREELAARWRGLSDEIEGRGAEFDGLLEDARALHREKSLALELAARVSEVADEYNMPDAAQLRAELETAQADQAAALAEVERLTREKDAASGPAAFLAAPPESIVQTVTDDTGAFRLPLSGPTGGLAVLVVAEAPGDRAAPVRGWLAPLDPAQDRTALLRFSADNHLDSEAIKQIAAASP